MKNNILLTFIVLLILSLGMNYFQYRHCVKSNGERLTSNRVEQEHLQKIAVLELQKQQYKDSAQAVYNRLLSRQASHQVVKISQRKKIDLAVQDERRSRPDSLMKTKCDSAYNEYEKQLVNAEQEKLDVVEDYEKTLHFEQLSRDISDSIARHERHRGDSLYNVATITQEKYEDATSKPFAIVASVGANTAVHGGVVRVQPGVHLGVAVKIWSFRIRRRK
jgi:hypothetical protein